MPQVTTSSFNLGYPPFANWINNFDDNHAPRPLPPRPPRPGKMKTVFLLNLTNTTNLSIRNTLYYYWQNYPQEFIECPIVDTKGSLDTTLSLLDEYYGYGFKYFIGFQTSNIMSGVLSSNWFNFHPDAIGITPSANSNSLSVPKNIYRFLPDNSFIINSIDAQINSAINGGYNIYYIYTLDQIVCSDALRILNQTIGSYPNYRTLGTVFNDLNTPTIIQNFLNNPPNSVTSSSDVLIILLLNRSQYLSLYDVNLYAVPLTFPGQQYDLLASVNPVIPDGSQTALSNKYNVLLFKGVNTSILWRNGYVSLGSSNYSTVTLNILNLLNTFANNTLVDNINSHYGSLTFDPVTKDMLYPNILLQKFVSGVFNYTYLYVEDPYLGTYNAILTGASQPITTIDISPNKPFYGKAIALLELTNSLYTIDQIINDSIYYCWYKDNSLPKFPIVDTEAVTDITPLLDQYYADGYRVFLGMSRAEVLQASVDWFTSHPDTVGISQFGAGEIANVPSNFFRVQLSDSSIVGMFANDILTPAAPYGIYYVYSESSETAQSIKALLQFLYGAQVYTLAINGTTPLNYTTLNPFFTGIQANSVVVTFLISNQSYVDAFNDPSMNPLPAKQYLTNYVNAIPTITNVNAQNALDTKLFNLTPTFPNTSNLWNEVRLYLTDKYDVETTSFQTINSLKMIQYILAGKDTKLLGSHSGVLQFNPAAPPSNPPPPPPRFLTYASALLTQYQKTPNTFVNYSITFQDPLIGNFVASFV
jgi:hypothetical protein